MGIEAPERPAELSLLDELEYWNTMPLSGGLLEQPYTLMADLRAVRRARVDQANSKLVSESLQDKVDALKTQAYQMAGQVEE